MSGKNAIAILLGFLGLAMGALPWQAWEQPAHFPKPHYDFASNPMRPAAVELGRFLFYDPVLSLDSTISCASCHSPYNSFAHTDHDLSHGIGDQIGTRNAPALFNLAWQPTFMWDGAAQHLDMQALAPISHPGEMREEIGHVVQKLQRIARYRSMFQAAFQDSLVSGQHVLQALAQFQLTLVSGHARYDSMRLQEVKFSPQESNGYALFQQHCNSCHQEPLFSTYTFANNGLSVDSTLNDPGRFGVTQRAADFGMFKIPSLRNLSYSFPYMHDGRFKKLSQVLNHYTSGIVDSPTLAPQLRQPIALNANEKVDLIAFLLTLNDRNFVFEADHQFPRELLK